MRGLLDLIDSGMSGRYNTQLNPVEEVLYNAWAAKQGKSGDVYDYDLRGAFRDLMSGGMSQADNGHLGDRYKKPNHPTFSNQSVYSSPTMQGGEWIGSDFKPSAYNLQNMSPDQLREYFKRVEPNSKLIGLLGK
jgi:hypothetical protein